MWKTVRINMTTLSVTEEPYKNEYMGLGGRGLVAQVLLDEVNPVCDPLGPENKLVFSTTAFAGMGLGCVNRLSVGCKSPLTGGIKEANAGGTAATYMANHAIRLIIIEGQPSQDGLWTLRIDAQGKACLDDATAYQGMNNYKLIETFLEKYGNNIAAATIGVAGERMYKNSTVQTTEYGTNYPCRAAARGGVGSVMGSKKIKAVVLEKADESFKPEYADKEAFIALRTELNKLVYEEASQHELRKIGTPAAVQIHHQEGMLPVRNFSGKHLENLDQIYPAKFAEIINKRGKSGHPCQAGCMVQCSNQIFDTEGNYVTAGLEYETIALCGANTAITDLDAIARIDRMCDDLGIDTIETGATLGLCMDGGRIPWGDAQAAMGLIKEMNEGTEFGRLMGSGAEAVGKYLGVSRIPVAKHMAFPGYDIRGAAPTGVAFAGGAQGADHTTCPSAGTGSDMTSEEICKLSYNIQTVFAMCDSLICILAWLFLDKHLDKVAALYAAAYGGPASPDRLLELGAMTLKREKEFNRAAGWKDEDDIIPEFFYTEKSEMTGTAFNVPQEYFSKTVVV